MAKAAKKIEATVTVPAGSTTSATRESHLLKGLKPVQGMTPHRVIVRDPANPRRIEDAKFNARNLAIYMLAQGYDMAKPVVLHLEPDGSIIALDGNCRLGAINMLEIGEVLHPNGEAMSPEEKAHWQDAEVPSITYTGLTPEQKDAIRALTQTQPGTLLWRAEDKFKLLCKIYSAKGMKLSPAELAQSGRWPEALDTRAQDTLGKWIKVVKLFYSFPKHPRINEFRQMLTDIFRDMDAKRYLELGLTNAEGKIGRPDTSKYYTFRLYHIQKVDPSVYTSKKPNERISLIIDAATPGRLGADPKTGRSLDETVSLLDTLSKMDDASDLTWGTLLGKANISTGIGAEKAAPTLPGRDAHASSVFIDNCKSPVLRAILTAIATQDFETVSAIDETMAAKNWEL